ncbi:unnamed protein product, partial [Amoebophrya sp. A25]
VDEEGDWGEWEEDEGGDPKAKLLRMRKQLREQQLERIRASSTSAKFNKMRKRVSSTGGKQIAARIQIEEDLAREIVRVNQAGERPWDPLKVQREFIRRMIEEGEGSYYGVRHGTGHKATWKWYSCFTKRHELKSTRDVTASSIRSDLQLRDEIFLTWGRWMRYLESIRAKSHQIYQETGELPLVIRCNLDETFLRSHVATKAACIPKFNARRVNRSWPGSKKTTKEGCTGIFFITDHPSFFFKPTISFHQNRPSQDMKDRVAANWQGSAYIEKDGNSLGNHQID